MFQSKDKRYLLDKRRGTTQMVGVAKGHCQGIGGIGTGKGAEFKQNPDHFLDLTFFSLSVSGHCLFHFSWRIIKNRNPLPAGGHHGRAPGLSQF